MGEKKRVLVRWWLGRLIVVLGARGDFMIAGKWERMGQKWGAGRRLLD